MCIRLLRTASCSARSSGASGRPAVHRGRPERRVRHVLAGTRRRHGSNLPPWWPSARRAIMGANWNDEVGHQLWGHCRVSIRAVLNALPTPSAVARIVRALVEVARRAMAIPAVLRIGAECTGYHSPAVVAGGRRLRRRLRRRLGRGLRLHNGRLRRDDHLGRRRRSCGRRQWRSGH